MEEMEDHQVNVEHSAQPHRIPNPATAAAYWRANLRLLGGLMAIWFLVSYGFGILGVEALNRISLFGFKLGFWWAQQGSIYVFIGLIFYYCWRMRRLDRTFGLEDTDSAKTGKERDL